MSSTNISPTIISYSESLLLSNNHLKKNDPKFSNLTNSAKTFSANILHPIIATIALVESAVTSIFLGISLFTLPFTTHFYNYNQKWLNSSFFVVTQFLSFQLASSSTHKVQNITISKQCKTFIPFYQDKPTNGCLGKDGYLGNYHPCPNGVTVEIGKTKYQFQNSEAAFKAWKTFIYTKNPNLINNFLGLTGEQAGKECRKLLNGLQEPPEWIGRSLNIQVMQAVLNAKFTQNPSLNQKLKDTGRAYLVEHVEVKGRDNFWADDFDGTGKNMLGQLLMELRAQLGGAGVVLKPAEYNQFVKGTGQMIFQPNSVASSPSSGRNTAFDVVVDANKCKLPGCQKARHIGFDFCKRGHGAEYKSKNNNQEPCKKPTCGKPRDKNFPNTQWCGRSHIGQ